MDFEKMPSFATPGQPWKWKSLWKLSGMSFSVSFSPRINAD